MHFLSPCTLKYMTFVHFHLQFMSAYNFICRWILDHIHYTRTSAALPLLCIFHSFYAIYAYVLECVCMCYFGSPISFFCVIYCTLNLLCCVYYSFNHNCLLLLRFISMGLFYAAPYIIRHFSTFNLTFIVFKTSKAKKKWNDRFIEKFL